MNFDNIGQIGKVMSRSKKWFLYQITEITANNRTRGFFCRVKLAENVHIAIFGLSLRCVH